ncbi:MAG: rRNA pseudouridine synthase [Candidatus Aminicenantes bacterium]|nr:rRNA pseudouridine synthase [Candidatus Aminicenantes bacterium]
MREMRLQKYLQDCGLASRRDIRQWIHEGRLRVGGRVVTDPNFPVRVPADPIQLNGKRLKLAPQPKSYFIFNKPPGVVSTLADPEGRPALRAYIGRIRERVYPVGRLDFHSDGLMLLTNDGELAQFILAARNAVPKTYLLKIKGTLEAATRSRLEGGIFLEGERLNPFAIEEVRTTGSGNSWLRVTITEGKKHILRKAFLYSGHPVEKLRRLAIGTFTLGTMPLGQWRELRDAEVAKFKRQYHYPG